MSTFGTTRVLVESEWSQVGAQHLSTTETWQDLLLLVGPDLAPLPHLLQGAKWHPSRRSCRMAAPSTKVVPSQVLLLTSTCQVMA